MVARDDTGDDDIAVAVRVEMVGAVRLQPFTQRLGDGVAEARLQRLVVERQNLDGFFAGDRAIDRAEMIAGATGEQRQRAEPEKFQAGAF